MQSARGVLLDVADEVDVAQPVARLLAQLAADGIHELGDQAIAQLTHRVHYRTRSGSSTGTLAEYQSAKRFEILVFRAGQQIEERIEAAVERAAQVVESCRRWCEGVRPGAGAVGERERARPRRR